MINKKAWTILTTDEQSALTLQLGMEKSSWESGEIIGKSHYKYLEIKYRAEQFLKMFTERVGLFTEIFPDYLPHRPLAYDYFKQCILYRKKPREAIEAVVKKNLLIRVNKNTITEAIIAQLDDWSKSGEAFQLMTYDFVKEFDRWNNFRILPKQLQEPSAYKRRQKNNHKKHLRVMSTIHPISLDKLVEFYKPKPGTKKIYLAIFTNNEGKVYELKNVKGCLDILNEIGLYVYTDFKIASEYLEHVSQYLGKEKRACADGLEFWPKYRELIKKAENYDKVQHINPSRRYLQQASKKLEFL